MTSFSWLSEQGEGDGSRASASQGFGHRMQERMVEAFALWLNAARQNKPSSGYYVREGDGFRHLEGETPNPRWAL
jgi:hypothetical protein